MRSVGRGGDRILYGLCAAAGLLAAVVLGEIAYQVISGANLSISHYGLDFLWHSRWAPNFGIFGAATALYGTAVSSVFALALATPLGIAIGIYLAMIAPPAVRAVVGPLVEMLAAIPSVIVGFWGAIVMLPFLNHHIEPTLHNAFGFIPLFGAPQSTGSLFAAGLVLTLMTLPIIASLSRDLFLTVPRELKEGAEALGATRWEVIRGVVLPTTVSGVAAATVLGLGRALGEAIAVLQVVGDGAGVHSNLFLSGKTMASQVALDFGGAVSKLHLASVYYLALILLVIGVTTSLAARMIAGRFQAQGLAS